MKIKPNTHIKVLDCSQGRHNNRLGKIVSNRRDGFYNVRLKNSEDCVAFAVEVLFKSEKHEIKETPVTSWNLFYFGEYSIWRMIGL